MIGGRTQVLLQDDIEATESIMWRVQTNATITISSSGTSATLQIGDAQMTVEILSPSSGAVFTTMDPVRLATDPPLPSGQSDLVNTGVTVLVIALEPGTNSLQVLWTPQCTALRSVAPVTPPSVPVSSWTLTSHNT